MIAIFNTKSVLIQNAMVFAFIVILLIVFVLQKAEVKGLKRITKGFFFILTGSILIIFRGRLPNYLTIIVANILNAYGKILISHGVRVFKQASERLFNYELLSIIPFALLIIYFGEYNPDIVLSKIIAAMYSIYFQYRIFEVVFFKRKKTEKYVSYLICFFMSLSLLSNVYKITAMLAGPITYNYFESEDYEGISIILSQLAYSMLVIGVLLISNKQLENELKLQAMTDSLTGLFNRNAFNQLANKQIEKSKRDDKKIGFVFCDIDHFKNINDTYGHMVGDQVIVNFANLLKDNLRISDLLGRFGGEEFTIIMPEIETSELFYRLDDIRNQIEKDSSIVNDKKINITASFGAVLFSPGDMNIEKAFAIADNALYEAKNSGRNKVVVKNVS